MNSVGKILAEEHTVLFNAIEAAEKLHSIESVELCKNEIAQFVSLFDVFTNEFHHPKEEEVLYPLLLKKKDIINKRILNEITKDHHALHDALDAVKMKLKSPKNKGLEGEFSKYLKLLYKHIWRENIIVFINISYFITKEEAAAVSKIFEDIDRRGDTKKKIKSKLVLHTKKINKKYK